MAARLALLLLACVGPPRAELFSFQASTAPQRARPPRWTADVLDAFFEDAREKLAGQRPDYGAGVRTAVANESARAGSANAASTAKAAWSRLIDGETLEAEIKRLAQAVAGDVTTPGEFTGGKFQNCRRHFSVLAMLFAVIAEFDGDVRWQDTASGLREMFARAGHNCKVGTDQTFREAAARKADLADLIRGSRPQVPSAERAADWGQVADRPPLMQRMNIAHEERLTKWLADERRFAQHRDEARHEAQLVAVIAEVIGREGFDYWDDAEYAEYAGQLRRAAIDVAAAVEQDDFTKGRDAVARMTKACTDCHDGYRE